MTKGMTTLASYAMIIRFRYAEVLFQPSLQPAVFTVLFPEQYDMRRRHPQEFARQYRVVRRQGLFFSRTGEHMFEELTALVHSR